MSMILRKQSLLIFSIVFCFIFHGLSGEAAGNDIRTGIDSDTALKITIDCIQAASGIVIYKTDKIPSGEKYKADLQAVLNKIFTKISPEDSLKQIGITDEQRLNALRNYIVRNREFGVPSLWGQNRTTTPYQLQNYVIPFSALKKVNMDTSIAELASIIKANAGLPFLSLKKAASIVSCCRCLTDDCKKENKCEKAPTGSSNRKNTRSYLKNSFLTK